MTDDYTADICPEGAGCPSCGELRLDWLEWRFPGEDDEAPEDGPFWLDYICCLSCGTCYVPGSRPTE